MFRHSFVLALLASSLCAMAFPAGSADHGTIVSFIAPTCGTSTLAASGTHLGSQAWVFEVAGNAVNGGSCIGFRSHCTATGSPESGWTSTSCEPACVDLCLVSFSLTGSWNARPPFGPANREPVDQASATLTLAFTSGFPSTDYTGILTIVG